MTTATCTGLSASIISCATAAACQWVSFDYHRALLQGSFGTLTLRDGPPAGKGVHLHRRHQRVGIIVERVGPPRDGHTHCRLENTRVVRLAVLAPLCVHQGASPGANWHGARVEAESRVLLGRAGARVLYGEARADTVTSRAACARKELLEEEGREKEDHDVEEECLQSQPSS